MSTVQEILQFKFDPGVFGSLGKQVFTTDTQRKVKANTDKLLTIANGAGATGMSKEDQQSIVELFHLAYESKKLDQVFASRKRIKRLAFCLNVEIENYSTIANDKAKLGSALSLLKSQRGAKVTWGLLIALLESWSIPSVRSAIFKVLRSRINKEPELRSHKLLLKNAEFLLRKKGVENYADFLIADSIPLRQSMHRLGLPEHLHASQFALSLANRYTNLLTSRRTAQTTYKDLLTWTASRSSKDYGLATLPTVILNAPIREREALEKAALTVIGDPSLPDLWSSDNPALKGHEGTINSARTVLQSWLSERLIKLFFQRLQVPGEDRLLYWARWAKHIDNILIGADAANTRRLLRNDELADYIKGRLITVTGTHATALVMKFKDRAMVELAENGNALYVHYWRDVEPLLSSKKVRSSQLRDTSMPYLYRSSGRSIYSVRQTGRAVHRDNWQYHFDAWMRRQLGIEPSGQ